MIVECVSERTNNHAKGWHSHLKKVIVKAHFLETVESFKTVEKLVIKL